MTDSIIAIDSTIPAADTSVVDWDTVSEALKRNKDEWQQTIGEALGITDTKSLAILTAFDQQHQRVIVLAACHDELQDKFSTLPSDQDYTVYDAETKRTFHVEFIMMNEKCVDQTDRGKEFDIPREEAHQANALIEAHVMSLMTMNRYISAVTCCGSRLVNQEWRRVDHPSVRGDRLCGGTYEPGSCVVVYVPNTRFCSRYKTALPTQLTLLGSDYSLPVEVRQGTFEDL